MYQKPPHQTPPTLPYKGKGNFDSKTNTTYTAEQINQNMPC